MPVNIEAHLCDEDRDRLDTNFIRLKNLIKLNFLIVISIGALVGICLMGSVIVSKSVTDKRHEYEHHIRELESWQQENAMATSLGNSTVRTIQISTVNGKPDAGSKTSPTATPSPEPTPSTA